MILLTILFVSLSWFGITFCQTNPIITEWTRSTGLGYGDFKTNVYKIEYSSNSVWVSTNSIPSFSIGPWASNPNDALGMNYTFVFPLNPSYNTGTAVEVPLGHIGLWINGVSVYNADDGMTYNNLGIWKRNAYIFEGVSFDSCKGHPDGSSEYHQHISSGCLYNTSSSSHSPLIGFAFDGFPIYGPYGYSTALDSSSSIKRMETSYKLRNITDRTTLADGTVLDAAYYGPSIADYSLSSFIEDYEYQSGYGDLDEYNGRYCKTPEYPNGTYAYFIATDASLTPVYPFVLGPYFKGNILPGNTGPNSGNLSPKSAVVYYEYNAVSNSNSTDVTTVSTASASSTTVSTASASSTTVSTDSASSTTMSTASASSTTVSTSAASNSDSTSNNLLTTSKSISTKRLNLLISFILITSNFLLSLI